MKLRSSLFAKLMAGIFMIVFAAACVGLAGLSVVMTVEWQVYREDYRDTDAYHNEMSGYAWDIHRYYALTEKSQTQPLSEEEKSREEYLYARIYPLKETNLVWLMMDASGQPLHSNLTSGSPTRTSIDQMTGKRSEYVQVESKYVAIGLRSDMPFDDEFTETMSNFRLAKKWFVPSIAGGGVCAFLTIVLFSFLVAAAGHREGEDGIVLNFFDRIWLEPLVFFYGIVFLFGVASLFDGPLSVEASVLTLIMLVPLGLILLFSVIRRAKAKQVYQTTFLHFAVRVGQTIWGHLHILIRIIGIMVVYGLVQMVLVLLIANGSMLAFIFWLLSNMAVMAFVCIIGIQYDHVRDATDRMAAGHFGRVADEQAVPFFRHMARSLNSTGNAMNLAVERAMKSERMKTDLIANVSHDIKTPITSIISYVDLLKTTGIENDKALEYIDVLDRKSRRLAQLMTDLVDAAKVTTGNVSVSMEVLNLGELVKQAGGEFESRLEERGIALVCSLPDSPVCVMADGRHMWRVLDNLFGNAAKYALDGTRVYVDVWVNGQDVFLAMKNISRDALNVRPDELMERFVRGDESRHTEGSGLGLSIARSLIELQNGTMTILIDGDLFKVVLKLKRGGQPCEPVYPPPVS